jgi:hypothetical protein
MAKRDDREESTAIIPSVDELAKRNASALSGFELDRYGKKSGWKWYILDFLGETYESAGLGLTVASGALFTIYMALLFIYTFFIDSIFFTLFLPVWSCVPTLFFLSAIGMFAMSVGTLIQEKAKKIALDFAEKEKKEYLLNEGNYFRQILRTVPEQIENRIYEQITPLSVRLGDLQIELKEIHQNLRSTYFLVDTPEKTAFIAKLEEEQRKTEKEISVIQTEINKLRDASRAQIAEVKQICANANLIKIRQRRIGREEDDLLLEDIERQGVLEDIKDEVDSLRIEVEVRMDPLKEP